MKYIRHERHDPLARHISPRKPVDHDGLGVAASLCLPFAFPLFIFSPLILECVLGWMGLTP